MKRIAQLAFAIVPFFMGGCDDKLEIAPKGQLIISTAKEYSSLLDNRYYQLYDNQLAWTASFDAGLLSSTVVGEAYQLDKINYLGLTDRDRTIDFKNSMFYESCYERISRFNIIIENIGDSKGSEEDKKRTKAEASLLRAYNYFVLVNTFCKHYSKTTAKKDGGLLLRTKFSLEEKVAQSSVDDAYRLIEEDINSALPFLQSKGENVNHPGLAFAYGLLAKVHLFKQEFDKAQAAAELSLSNNSYIFDMVAWDQGPKPVPEIGYGNEENLYFGYGTYFGSLTSYYIGPRLVKKYGTGDLRKERFFWDVSASALPGCCRFRTFTDIVNGSKVTRYIKFNIGGMKVSEVVLMLAECHARAGRVKEAMDLVNGLRKKRILPVFYTDLTASTKEEALSHVIDERSRELVLTPNNFYDIRRLEVEGIHQSVERVLPDGSKYTVNSNSHVFVMPFPRDAIELSRTLKQNVDK